MPGAVISSPLRLQTAVSDFTAPSLSPSFKLDEGYSDDTKSQADKDLGLDNVMALPNWVLAQSEAGRAGKISLFFNSIFSVCQLPCCEALRLLSSLCYCFADSTLQSSHTVFSDPSEHQALQQWWSGSTLFFTWTRWSNFHLKLHWRSSPTLHLEPS